MASLQGTVEAGLSDSSIIMPSSVVHSPALTASEWEAYERGLTVYQQIANHTGLASTKLDIVDMLMAMADEKGPPLEELSVPEFLQWDLQLGLPLTHVSFLLNQLIPRRHITKYLSIWNTGKLSSALNAVFADSSSLRPELAGSIPEGFAVPPTIPRHEASEFLRTGDESNLGLANRDSDVVFVAVEKLCGFRKEDGVRYMVETEHTYPGYCRLVAVNPEQVHVDFKVQRPGHPGVYYMKGEQIMKEFIGGLQLQIMLGTYGSIDSSISRHGPAISVDWVRKLMNFQTNADLVVALPCKEWPAKVAASWLGRSSKSGWPPQELKGRLVSEGCLMVAASHNSSTWGDVEWRISFSRVERVLANTMSDVQRQCYILLKVLIKHVLEPNQLITSYHLKTLLFWTCEKVHRSTWEEGEGGLGGCFLLLLDELLHMVLRRHLPHYFFTDNNLFANIQADFMVDIGRKIAWLRRNLSQAIFDFDKCHVFAFSLHKFSLQTFIQPLLDEASEPYTSVRRAYASYTKTLLLLAKAFAANENMDDMIDSYREASHIQRVVFDRHVDFMSLVIDLLMEFPPVIRIETYERIFRRFPNSNGIYGMKGNTACLYLQRSFTTSSQPDSELMSKRARTLFEEATSDSGATCATWTDYANFLYKMSSYEEAVSAATQALALSRDSHEEKNIFTEDEILTVPECISNDIEKDGPLTVHSRPYATLLMVLCQLEMGNTDTALSSMGDLQALVMESAGDVAAEFTGSKLAGYGWMALARHQDSRQAFSRALELRPESTAAAEGSMLCEAMLMSLDT